MGIRYYSYVSTAKVAQLYEQISDLSDVTETSQETSEKTGGLKASGGLAQIVSGGLEGSLRKQTVVEYSGKRGDIQKLGALIWYIDQNEQVDNLNQLCQQGSGAKLQAFAYTYRGEFHVGRDRNWQSDEARPLTRDIDQAISSAAEFENSEFADGRGAGRRLVSEAVILESRCYNYTINLACSLKHFANMGAHVDGDTLRIHSHSGNHHFFSGKTTAFLEGLVFVTSVRDRVIIGSPLFLNYYSQPGLSL